MSDSYHSFCRAILLIVQSDYILSKGLYPQCDSAPEKVIDFLQDLSRKQRLAFLERNQRFFGGPKELPKRITRMIERGSLDGLEGVFYRLADRWKLGTMLDSHIGVMQGHPACQQIIDIGMPVIPLIMQELQIDPDDGWLDILEEIVGVDSPVIPQELEEKPQLKIGIWLEWGRSHALI